MWDIDATTTLLRDMSSTSDPSALLRLVLTHARRTTHVERALVLTRDGQQFPSYRILLACQCGTAGADLDLVQSSTRAGGALASLLYQGQFRICPEFSPDPFDDSYDLLHGHRGLIAFPLYERAVATGMVVLLGPAPGDCDVTELSLLAVLGALLQRADRALTLTKELETTCRALDAELAAAAAVQQCLLPPASNSSEGVAASSFYRTARHASGDYYDAGVLPDGNFGVVIADASGHGAAASVLMAILRTIIHAEVDRSRIGRPAALLDHANAHLCSIGIPGSFVTALSGALDTQSGRFTYAVAGHPPARLLRAADSSVAPLTGASSLPLGVLEESAPRSQETIKLEPGDLLLFYTDGIIEARSATGELFGISRLDAILSDLPRPASPHEAVRVIRLAVDAFTDAATPTDDQTLLAVRWQPDRAGPYPPQQDEAR